MPQLVNAIAIGLILSLFLSEFAGLSAAGLIVPGYLAFYFNDPLHIFVILFATLYTWITEKFVSHFTILYGKRVFALNILTSFIYVYLMENILFNMGFQINHIMDVVGYFVPALIVIYIGANGIVNTLLSLTLITLLVRIAILLLPI